MDAARKLPTAASADPSKVRLSALAPFDWCNRQLERPALWLAVVLVVIAMQAALIVTHRAWLDEWQALEIALQSPSFAALLDNLRYEGHPPLWYLLLRGASALVTPRFAVVAVQLPIALALQLLILLKLPLPRLERLLFAFNFYVLIDYSMIARPFGLGVLLFMAAILYRERRAAWTAVALLPMVDFLFGILSLACLAIFGREKRLWTPGLVLWLLVAIAAAWTVRPAPDVVPAILTTSWWRDGGMVLSRLGSVLLPLQMQGGHLQWDGDLPFLVGAPLGIAFVLFGWKLCADRFSKLLFGAFAAFIFAFSVFAYPLSSRHLSLAGVLLVVLVAIGGQTRQQPIRRLFAAWFGVGAVLGLTAAALNFAQPFDTSAEAAAYIRGHSLAAKHWAAYPDFESQGVSALTGMEFERVGLDCTQTFVRWNRQERIASFEQLEQSLGSRADRGGNYYLLSQIELPSNRIGPPDAFRLLTHIPAGYDGKDYFIYRIRPDLPEQRAPVPPCAPARLPMPRRLAPSAALASIGQG